MAPTSKAKSKSPWHRRAEQDMVTRKDKIAGGKGPSAKRKSVKTFDNFGKYVSKQGH